MTKVLQIVESFDGQATERWLENLTSESVGQDRGIQWTFFCIMQSPGKYSEKVTENGGEVICSPYPISNALRFLSNLRRVLREGQYDVMHCHHDIMSGLYLLASIGLPIRRRIVHIHNTALSLPTKSPIKSFIAERFFKWICLGMADRIVGVSVDALHTFCDPVLENAKFKIVHCGVDISPFLASPQQSDDLREELGIPVGAKILLFVGRMIPYKNPLFVLEIFEKLVRSELDIYAVFAGRGPMIDQVADMARKMDISHRVRLLGERDDIPFLMLSSDMLICPSEEVPKEGLGLVIIEAQAAGLKTLMSKSIPEEAIVIPTLVTSFPLDSGAHKWARAVVDILENSLSEKKDECSENVQNSSYSISNSLKNVRSLYI